MKMTNKFWIARTNTGLNCLKDGLFYYHLVVIKTYICLNIQALSGRLVCGQQMFVTMVTSHAMEG